MIGRTGSPTTSGSIADADRPSHPDRRSPSGSAWRSASAPPSSPPARVPRGPMTATFGILYTIPSLALFAFLVPFTGLTLVTAEIGLISYTLLILTRNILTGLDGIAADVREAAVGMGLPPAQRLFRRRAAAGRPGDHGRGADRDRDDGRPRNGHGDHRRGRPRPTDAASGFSRIPDHDLRRRHRPIILAARLDLGPRGRPASPDAVGPGGSSLSHEQHQGALGWLSDPAHWEGRDGVPTRFLEHVELAVAADRRGLLIGLPMGLATGTPVGAAS